MAFPIFWDVSLGAPILTPASNWLDFSAIDKTCDHRLLKSPLCVDYKGVTQFLVHYTTQLFWVARLRPGRNVDGREHEAPNWSVFLFPPTHLTSLSRWRLWLQPNSLVTHSRKRTCDENLALMGLLVSGAKTEMVLFREASGSQISGDKHAWAAHPAGCRRTYVPHWSASVFTSTRAFRGLLQRLFSSVSNAASQRARKGRDRRSWRPAKSLGALPVVTFSSIPTLRETFLPFTFYRRGNLGAWSLSLARPSQLLSGRLRNQTWV